MELSENQKLQFIEASYHTASDLDPEKKAQLIRLFNKGSKFFRRKAKKVLDASGRGGQV